MTDSQKELSVGVPLMLCRVSRRSRTWSCTPKLLKARRPMPRGGAAPAAALQLRSQGVTEREAGHPLQRPPVARRADCHRHLEGSADVKSKRIVVRTQLIRRAHNCNTCLICQWTQQC